MTPGAAAPPAVVEAVAGADAHAATISTGPGRPEWRAVARAYLASRLVVLAAAALAARHWGRFAFLPNVLGTWDGRWYIELARHGYPAAVPAGSGAPAQSTLAFFPLFPLVVRLVAAALPGGELAAAFLVSTVAGAAACLAVQALAARLLPPRQATRAAIAFAFFPGAFILSMAYAEGLAIALSALCLVALLDRRWWLAGLTAALATACRPNAVALVAACLVVAVHELRTGTPARRLAPLALAPTGLVATMVVLWARTGSALVWLQAEKAGWRQQFDLGATTVQTVGHFVGRPFSDVDTLIVGAGVLVVVALAFALRHRLVLPPPVAVYTVVVVALCYGSSSLNGRPRFLLAAFPLLFPLARLRRRTFVAAMCVSAAAMAALMWFVGVQLTWAP